MERRTNTVGIKSASHNRTSYLLVLANKYFPELEFNMLSNAKYTIMQSGIRDTEETVEINSRSNLYLVRNKNHPDFQQQVLSKHEVMIAVAHRMLSLSDGDYIETPRFKRFADMLAKGNFGIICGSSTYVMTFLEAIEPDYEKLLYKLKKEE